MSGEHGTLRGVMTVMMPSSKHEATKEEMHEKFNAIEDRLQKETWQKCFHRSHETQPLLGFNMPRPEPKVPQTLGIIPSYIGTYCHVLVFLYYHYVTRSVCIF